MLVFRSVSCHKYSVYIYKCVDVCSEQKGAKLLVLQKNIILDSKKFEEERKFILGEK